MNGVERVFTRVRRAFNLHTWAEIDELMSAYRGWSKRAATANNLLPCAVIRIHDITGISMRELLDLLECRTDIEPMPILKRDVRYLRDKLRPEKVEYENEHLTKRTIFEEWAKGKGLYTRRDGITYYDETTALCWSAWQTAQST